MFWKAYYYEKIHMTSIREKFFQSTDNKVWTELLSSIFGGVDIIIDTLGDFSGTLEIRDIADLNLVAVTSTPAQVLHDCTLKRFTEQERFLVKTQLLGQSQIVVGDHRITLNEGDFLICDNARSYTLNFKHTTTILSIPIPAKMLRRFHAHPEDLAFIKVDRKIAANQIISDFIKSMWQTKPSNKLLHQAERYRDIYFDLLVMGFENADTVHGSISSVQSEHLERCKNFIETNFDDDELDIDQIAKGCAISKRYLHSISSVAGMSVSNYMITIRLDHAAQMLRKQRFKKLSISEILYDCGFKSTAHFSRAFKSRFNETPTSYRKKKYY